MQSFDLCILTAANEVQAKGYKARLAEFKARQPGLKTEFMVIADPRGQRIGSGGSTLYVLQTIYARAQKNFRKAFAGRRILIVHSGGDSRRLPAYSAYGKIFTPLPSPQHHTVFDIILNTYASLPGHPEGHVIITSGDVLLNFSRERVYFADKGITGVGYPDDAEAASHHGVFVPQSQAYDRASRVLDFLQKPDRDILMKHHAIDYQQRVWVDTGILHLAPDAVETMLRCKKLLAHALEEKRDINLYDHIPFAILGKKKIPDSDQLQKLKFHVSLLPYCGFFHIGRSKEFLYNLFTLTHAAAEYGFRSGIRSSGAADLKAKKVFVYNSIVPALPHPKAAPVLIENCVLADSPSLEGDNIVTGVPEGIRTIHLQTGVCLTVLPLKNGSWTALLYGIEDHFKSGVRTENNLFLNQPVEQWLQQRNLAPEIVWDKNKGDVWSARLFPVCRSAQEAVSVVQSLQRKDASLAAWIQADRQSLQWILRSVDHDQIISQQKFVERSVMLSSLEHILIADSELGSQQLLDLCPDPSSLKNLAQRLFRMAATHPDILLQSRLYFLLHRVLNVTGRPLQKEFKQMHNLTADKSLDLSFSKIRNAVSTPLLLSNQQQPHTISIRSDEVVWACSPARLDFAGGWSDTPPYCLEKGGTVLNAAVTLNGQYPIQVIAKINFDYTIRINSIDLGMTRVVNDMETLAQFTNPGDWLSLPKAALWATGLFRLGEKKSLDRLLHQFGGGIDLTLFSALPAGSGLGTSSILGATAIAAVSKMFGISMTREELFQKTSYLEQLMTTGGGWQDQIGGIVGGVKIIETDRGYEQLPTIRWTSLADGPDHPYLLYYTGIRRMAKNILRQVVSRYLDRDPEALRTLADLKAIAYDMKSALDRREIQHFGRLIGSVWECNKRLDHGSTTDAIEQIIERISPHMHGAKLLGAGGGGFLFIVCKGAKEKKKIMTDLQSDPINNRARFFDFAIDPAGLRVNVL